MKEAEGNKKIMAVVNPILKKTDELATRQRVLAQEDGIPFDEVEFYAPISYRVS
jgi:hypothetical protein